MAAVFFSRPAEHDLRRLPRVAQNALGAKHIPALEANPRAGKPLHGPLRGYFSYECGVAGVSYRIAYEMVKDDVIIVMVDARDDFYKKLSRRLRK